MKKVVVIGAGLGGLLSGCLLAKKGYQVTIFESHNTPGGYIAGFRRKGHYFESGTLSFEGSSMVFEAMKDIGVLDKVTFVKQNSRWMSKDFDVCPESYDDFKKAVFTAYPDDKDRLQKYFKETDKMYDAMKPFLKPPDSLLPRLGAYLVDGIRMLGIYSKYSNTTLGEFTAKYFDKDSKLYRLFSKFGYPEMSAYILGGAIATIFMDYWTVKDGMQSWADALAEQFKKFGGTLLLNSTVEKIITKDGTATGVLCNSKVYDADYVISAADYKKTFLKLLDNQSLMPEPQLAKIKNTAVSEGICTTYLALSILNDELRKCMKLPHIMYNDDQPGSEKMDSNDETYFDKISMNIYSPSLHNAKLSPEGESSVMIQMITPYHWMNNWGNGDKNEYNRLKEKVKNIMINKAASVIPGLKNKIIFSDFATPLTYERYTANTDGATSAWSWSPKNKFYDGTVFNTYVDTPVKNLYIGSCWATQIGGIPGAIGAAQNCSKKISG